MKLRMTLVIASLLGTLSLSACAGGQQNVQPNNSSTSEVATPTAATPTVSATASTTETSETPIEFTYLGLTPGAPRLRYKIKVLTGKPISQVDLGVRYMDRSGNVLDDTTLLWQNIVRSKREPIEKGKTYDVEDFAPDGTTKADVVLKRVVFTDGTYWQAK